MKQVVRGLVTSARNGAMIVGALGAAGGVVGASAAPASASCRTFNNQPIGTDQAGWFQAQTFGACDAVVGVRPQYFAAGVDCATMWNEYLNPNDDLWHPGSEGSFFYCEGNNIPHTFQDGTAAGTWKRMRANHDGTVDVGA